MDLRALISQLRAETTSFFRRSQSSFSVYSEESLPLALSEMGSHERLPCETPPASESAAVFTLSNPLSRGMYATARLKNNPLTIFPNEIESDFRPEYAALVDHRALAAPEELLDAPCLASSDMWTLGCVVRPYFWMIVTITDE